MSDKETMVEAHRRGQHMGRWLSCALCMASISPTPPPPSETELKEAIDGAEAAFVKRAFARMAFHTGKRWIDDGQASYPIEPYLIEADTESRAARSSLESLYRETLEENERLKRDTIAAEDAEHRARTQILGALGALDDVVPWEARCHGETLAQRIEYVKVELSALRSLQLTEEEKVFITDGLLLHAPGWRIPDTLSEKLRISSKATFGGTVSTEKSNFGSVWGEPRRWLAVARLINHKFKGSGH